jgi:hypothetical protein
LPTFNPTGLAVYNAVLLNVHFPRYLYKYLLTGDAPTFDDFKDAQPAAAAGVQALLDHEPAAEVEDVFALTFVASHEAFGEVREVELVPGGASVPVTGANRRAFAEVYANWALGGGAVAHALAAFRAGFLRVAGGPTLELLAPAELELLACGLPHLDFSALEKAARYEGGFEASSPAVEWFWEVVRGLPLDAKRRLLDFTTGSDRAPVGGLGALALTLQRAGPDSDRLPTSHTCFNTLLLPDYATRERLQERLLTAIDNARGFGLR